MYTPEEVFNTICEGNMLKSFIMLEKYSDINGKTFSGQTALMAACKMGQADTAARCIELGADVSIVCPVTKSSPVHLAIEAASAECLTLLIEAGACISEQNDSARTPLHRAVEIDNNLECIKILLENGAPLNTKGMFGWTPLHTAVGNTKYIKALLAYSPDLNVQDEKGKTPLHHAISIKHKATIKALVAAGARVDIADNRGATAATMILSRLL